MAIFATNKMGAYLDDGTIDAGQDSVGCAMPMTSFVPQVYSSTIINDTLNWVKVQGNFIATGNERFITIGNFFPDSEVDTFDRFPDFDDEGSGWYLIDDVSVIASDAVADAGPSTLIGNGDTVHIGSWEDGLPCTWYIQGNTTPIGYGGGISVHPASTTTYVLEMDLCGHVTYDTLTVYVVPASVPGTMRQPISIYPIPATNLLHIDHAAGHLATITDIQGRQYLTPTLTTDKETINIATLPPGTYFITLTNPSTGLRTTQKIQKE